MLDRLFVYGTLMSAAAGAPMGVAQRARLAGESHALGAATIAGRLIDLGHYPGLLPPLTAGDLVHGELLALRSPSATFAWLDRYEMIEPDSADNEYAREVRRVHLAGDAAAIETWVYLYIRPAPHAVPVAGGRWQR